MHVFFIILFIVLIIRPLRRILLRYSRLIIATAILFAGGYFAGLSLSMVAGPSWLRWLVAAVFVVEGLPQVLKYFDEILPQKN